MIHQSAICRKKFIPLAIVSRGDWLGTPANIKVYVGSSLTVHNPLLFVHKL